MNRLALQQDSAAQEDMSMQSILRIGSYGEVADVVAIPLSLVLSLVLLLLVVLISPVRGAVTEPAR
jgi:hypothetical protein